MPYRGALVWSRIEEVATVDSLFTPQATGSFPHADFPSLLPTLSLGNRSDCLPRHWEMLVDLNHDYTYDEPTSAMRKSSSSPDFMRNRKVPRIRHEAPRAQNTK